MTVIAWDGKTLAADRKISTSKVSTCQKLFRHKSHRIAIVGNVTKALMMKQWFEAGAKPAQWKWNDNTDSTLVVIKGNQAYCYVDEPVPYTPTNQFEAWGSGADYARAAMFLGYPAEEAVLIAAELDDDCGGGVDIL